MKTNKALALKLFAIVLSLLLVFGAFPVSALDATEYTEDETAAVAETLSEDATEETGEAADPTEDASETITEDPTEAEAEENAGEPVEVPTEELGITSGDNPNPDIGPEGEPPMNLSDGFYLIGPMENESAAYGWSAAAIRTNQKFTVNPADADEMMLYTTLEEGRKIKVVKVANGTIATIQNESAGTDASGELVWYPNGNGGEYTVPSDMAGDVLICFRKQSKTDWTIGGGHLYVTKSITVDDGHGGSTDQALTPDSADPTLTLNGYAKYADGSFTDWTDYATTWASASDKVYAKLTATDDKGINENSFLVTKGTSKTRPSVKKSGDFYYVQLTDGAPAKISVEDNAGNSDPDKSTVQTAQLNIDLNVPTKDDIVSVTFKKNTSTSFLNILTFGLYSKDNGIDMTVTVQPNGGSPISSIEVCDGTTPVTGGDIAPVADQTYGTVYERTFNLQDKNTAFDLKITNIVDTAGQKMIKDDEQDKQSKYVDVLSCDLFAEDKTSIATLYEIASVSELILPSITIPSDKITPAPVNEVYSVSEEAPLSMQVVFSEVISGLDESSLKAYIGTTTVLDNSESDYDFTKAGVTELSLTEGVTTQYGSSELSGKLIGKTATVTVPQALVTETDSYRIVFVATSNGGRTYQKAVDFNIDNTPPTVESHKVVYMDDGVKKDLADGQWTNKETRVELKITDAGAAFSKGVAKVTVLDSKGNELPEGSVTPVSGVDDTYTFTVDCHEGFTVTATDGYGHTSDVYTIAAADVRFDNEKPVIGEITYDTKAYAASPWQQETVVVSFNVTDKSEIEKIKGTWLSGKADTTVEIIGEDGQTYTAVRSDFDDDVPAHDSVPAHEGTGYTFTFESHTYQKYTIKATDKAGNVSAATDEELTVTEPTKIDKTAPYYTSFEIKPAEGAVLNVLTFGLYTPKDLTVTVNAADVAPSSGIVDITAKYDGTDLVAVGDLTTSGENVEENGVATASKTFIIPLSNSAAYDPSKLSFAVTDGSGRVNAKTLSELDTDTNVADNTDPAKVPYEIVVNNEKPSVDSIQLSPDPDYVNGSELWYNGNVNVEASATVSSAALAENRIAHLHSVSVTLNDDDVTANSTGAGQFTYYGEDTTNNTKLDSTNVTMNIKDVDAASVHKASGGNTENTIKIFAESNNGLNNNDNPTTKTFYMDDVAPQITAFEFDVDGTKHSVDDVTEDVVKTDYGYFFQYKTTVYAYVTDTIGDVAGSGVQSVTYYGTSVADYGSKGINSTTVTGADIKTAGDGSKYIEFTVYAGFKGNLFVSAVDNVGNAGHIYSVDGTVVENDAQHAEASGAQIDIKSTPVQKDNNGHDLFNGSVNVTMTVQDLYSGIDEIEYSITDHDGNKTTYNTKIGATYNDITGEPWTVVQSDLNLATKLSKDIVISKDTYNCNDIVIELKAFDKVGFEIKAESQTISIDVTNPTIEIVYDPVLGEANHEGSEYYFNKNRTATITVTERNFDPTDFDISKMIAIEGTMPALNPDANWSTSYTDYTDASTHVAKIYFTEDGKFEIDCDYTDMAGNAAEKKFEKETFYIDKTLPTMKVELVSDSTPANGEYYNKVVTARIEIVEHNFSESEPYFVYTGSATGADNHATATPPQVTGWTHDGDTHRATITFSADGMYSFRIAFKDLANNAGEDFEQKTFYVDQTINPPVITGVESSHAYSAEVMPVIDYEDYNFDYTNGYSYTLKKHWLDLDTMEQSMEIVKYPVAENRKSTATGLVVNYSDFERSELTEGVYELSAHVKDLANNEADSDTVIFSVNRFGSVFVLGSAKTVSLIDKGYTADAPDVAIREINVNSAREQKVSISHDSSTKQLTENTDYTIKHSGGATSWHESLYVINSKNFEDDGEYTVTVTSVDTFSNTVTNLTANTETAHERNCPVSFVVDKQDPEVKISGVDENGYYSEAEKTLHIVCIDENIDKASLAVKLDDQAYEVPEQYVDMDLVGEIEINLPITAQNGETRHKIEVEVKDMADNAGDDAINAFTLSATFLTMFLHNTVALIITGAVLVALAALAIVLVMKKRKGAAK